MGTVVACSTPFGSSGIAVVRLTGKESHKITSSLLKKPLNKKIHNSPVLCALADVDGSVFDEATTARTFALNGLIEGWKIGFQLLKKGSKATFYIPSGLGYGIQGNQSIPSLAILVFDVELVDVVN